MAALESPALIERPSLATLVGRIHGISTLPHVALLVMKVANNPNAGARELNDVMEVDAALTTRFLRCVNSSAYGLRVKITNLQQAIAYLGVNAIRNLAMTAGVSQLFRDSQQFGCYSRTGLWRHLVVVGICARLIAMRLRSKAFEDVYLAGLLHDIGIVLEDQHLHPAFRELIATAREGTTLPELESCQFGFDHTLLGEEMARKWNMPDGIADAIRHHHNSSGYDGRHLETVRCVEAANYICSLKGFSSVGTNLVACPHDAIRGLALGKTDLLVIAEDLDREMNDNPNMFHI